MNNIEDNFISYQLALDMKAIEFDKPCFAFYYEGALINDIVSKQDYTSPLNCLTPLYQQVFKFFREKYNLDKIIYPTLGSKGNYYINIFQNYNSENSLYWNCSYNTYEEAEIACIVKLINIVKTQKL